MIEYFYHFQLYVKNKQRARERRFNYGFDQNKPKACAVPQRAPNPKLETMGGQKVPPFRFKKLLPERELTLKEIPDEMRMYVLEHPEVEKVFSHPSYKENDSSTVCYKLEIQSYIKGFNLFEFWYMKQLPIENTE